MRRAIRPWAVLGVLLSVVVIGCTAFQSGDAPSGQRRPNLLLLLADDQRTDTLAAWGQAAIETPNIDRLVETGYSFRRAYCLGSPHGAVCVPSRAMLHTGHAYIGMNLSTFDGRATLGQLLRQAGYRTFASGKWHNGRETFARSFEAGRDVMLGGMSDHHAVPLWDFDGGEFRNEHVGSGHSSTLFADQAVAFLERSAAEREPFFLYVAFTAPHDPRDPPPELRDLYRDRQPPLPASFRGQHDFDNGFLVLRDEDLAAWPRSPETVREQLAEYWALITHLDREIGRILQALEDSGRAANTLVVYAADHGLALGSHGLLGKQSLYEHSMGTPLILSGPGIPRGESQALVYLHDLFPTLLGQAGIAAPDSESARDLSPLWTGASEHLRESLFHSMGRTQRAVSDGRWKLIRYPAVDHTQLFDLERDPDELENLADAARARDQVVRLRTVLESWQERLGDDVPWTNEQLAPLRRDLTGHGRKPDGWQPAWIRTKYFDD